MNQFSLLPASGYPLTSVEIIINISLAFVIGIVITTVYRLTNRNRPVSTSLILTLIILSMVVGMVMMVIGNSIARAFGLVGALSIIRFRTAVKDNRDIAFVFFSLAAGMAAGVGNYPLAVYGTGVISLLLLLLDYIHYGTPRAGVYLLRFQMVLMDSDKAVVEAILNKYLAVHHQISVKSVRMGQFMEYNYSVRMKNNNQLQDFIADLSAVEGMERVNMLADDEEPES
ncbi:MAG: DUF4956 domain-containing protein [bacterium]|nr:DUF4956 domain-containing protein [bacterium]